MKSNTEPSRPHPWIQLIGDHLGMIGLAGVLLWGSVLALARRAQDFEVFYQAWSWVRSGHADKIYQVSPDRFLYHPIFAWLFAPLSLLPSFWALLIWCVLKALLILHLIMLLSHPWERFAGRFLDRQAAASNRNQMRQVTCWGMLFFAKPLLIDFAYGQVNSLLLFVCVWGLAAHFEAKMSRLMTTAQWLVLTLGAVIKLYPLPLLLVPWLVTRGVAAQKLFWERLAVILGVLLAFGLPLLLQGWGGGLALYLDWKDALLARGLPLESHNQSFIALLYHYFSGSTFEIRSEGPRLFSFGAALLSAGQLVWIALLWSVGSLGYLFFWMRQGPKEVFKPTSRLHWVAVLVGLLIVPSHLVWKPYFVMSIPLAVVLSHWMWQKSSLGLTLLGVGLFLGVNLTGFDFLGHLLAAHIEAASFLLVLHLSLVVYAVRMR